MKIKIKNWPWWVKGGIAGILFYVFVVILLLGMLMIPEKWLLHVALGSSLWFLSWPLALVFYPAMYLNNNYEALGFIIPFNLVFYCFVGIFVAFVVKMIKEGIELV